MTDALYDLAVGISRAEAARTPRPDGTYVKVQRLPFGETIFHEATADRYEHDELTITCTDQNYSAKHGPMQIFLPGTWASSTVFSEAGYELFTFESEAARRERTEKIAAAMASFDASLAQGVQ